jgi:hypothetical protein
MALRMIKQEFEKNKIKITVWANFEIGKVFRMQAIW